MVVDEVRGGTHSHKHERERCQTVRTESANECRPNLLHLRLAPRRARSRYELAAPRTVSSGLWRILKWTVVLVLILSATLTIATAAVGDLSSTVQLGPLTLVVAGLTWKLPILTGRLQAWRVRRSDPNVAHPITHTLDDSGLHIGMRTLNAELKWAGMNRVHETPDMFLFYYSRRTAYFLPKRVVGPAADSAGLADWIRTRLPSDVAYITPGSVAIFV